MLKFSKKKEATKLNKEKFKGIVIGFVLCAALSAGILAVGAQTISGQLTYGVRVMLNNELMSFEESSRPFVMGGRTFLPLRALAEAVGLNVEFDSHTNTVFLGERTISRVPLRTAAPFFERSPNTDNNVVFRAEAAMNGVTYNDVLRFAHASYRTRGINASTHELNGKFIVLSGTFGREDSSERTEATVKFYGDGVVLQTYEFTAADQPKEIEISVRDVQKLRIEVLYPTTSSNSSWVQYAFDGYLH